MGHRTEVENQFRIVGWVSAKFKTQNYVFVSVRVKKCRFIAMINIYFSKI